MDIRCINWFENQSDTKYLYLKAVSRNSDVIFLKFDYYYYNVYDASKPSDKTWKEEIDLGTFSVLDIDERIYTTVDAVRQESPRYKNLRLVKLAKRCTDESYFNEYMNITWFYLVNSIIPDGCYEIDTTQLLHITKNCYYCKDIKKTFVREIPIFAITYTYLFFDIECQFDKKFPTIFVNPISHISCNIIDKIQEYTFTLINSNLIHTKEPDITEADQFSPNNSVTYCSEIILLRVIKKILEYKFDFIGSFNGHNFDIRYIIGRLEILDKSYIYFTLPDNTEATKLTIKERYQSFSSFANKTYHINNNNGTIFFDLYFFMQKTERLDSYKLDSISKNIFYCHGKIESVDQNTIVIIATLSENKQDKLMIFNTVLKTGNYITIDDYDIGEITQKEILQDKCIITVISEKSYEINSIHRLCFGKDDVNLQQLYKEYSLETALKIQQYCVHDACLCKYIWDYYRITSKINAASVTYLLPQCLALEYRASTLIKGPLLQLLLEEKILYNRSVSRVKYPYIGGKVFLPTQKTFDNNIAIFDYNSLYPNICIFANLSPEKLVAVIDNITKLDYEINIKVLQAKYKYPDYVHIIGESRFTNHYNEIMIYDKRDQGVIPKLLQILLTKRKTYKVLLKQATNIIESTLYDSLQYIYKIIANSVYGLMGFNNSTLYSYSSAKSCTTIGRNMITYLDNILDGAVWDKDVLTLAKCPENIFSGEKGEQTISVTNLDARFTFRSIYGDTDSVFLEVSNKNVPITLSIAKELESIINTHILHENFKIEFEAVYTQLILQSKKKYTTIKYSANYKLGDTPERINKGTSETRRDVAIFHKEMIQKYKDILMSYLITTTTGRDLTQNILQQLETELITEFNQVTPITNKYLLSRTFHNNYKSADHPNFELIKRYNLSNVEKIEIGERYFYIYICERTRVWQKKLCNIKSYEAIVDSKFSLPTNKRIFYEIYFKRLASEIVNLLPDRILCSMFFLRLFGTKPLFKSD